MARQSQREAGDTIVEVIIAVVVIASLLIGAFVVTNRSAQAVRDSQEHAKVLGLLQAQVELLRIAAANQKLPAALSQPFCFGSDLTVYQPPSTSCAGSSQFGTAVTYAIVCSPTSVGCPAASPATTTFNLKATWSGVTGVTEQVLLSYKVAVGS